MDVITAQNFREDSNGPSKIKRRKRISLTCTTCKQRKVKCDQGKPCSSCVKKRIPAHLCIYEDSPFIPTTSDSTNPTETIVLLKDENKKLQEQLDELKKWKEIVSGDPMPMNSNAKVNLYHSVHVKRNKTIYFGPTSWRTLLDKENNFADLIKSAKNYVSNVKKEWKVENNIDHIPFEEYKDVNVDSSQKLLTNLESFLPNYEIVREYLKLYAEGYWNHKLPIVDPEVLLIDFNQLFIRNGTRFHIKVYNKSIDYAKIALIVIIVKFVVTNINSYDKNSNNDPRDHLLRYTEKLLELSKYMSKSTVPALQTLIIMRNFRKMNPIDGDGGDSSEGALLHRTAINMAILLGLNKDVDSLYSRSSIITRNVLRNIWEHLLFQDAVLSFHLGIPLAIDENYIDPSYLQKNGTLLFIGGILRDAMKLLTKSSQCDQYEILQLIEKLETYNGGVLLTLSKDIKEFSNADYILKDYDNMGEIELKLFGIYILHVLYDVLYRGVDKSDPNVDIYYNGTMKYGSLCVTHFIEVLARLNRFCVENRSNPAKLFKIVEICLSVVGASKFVFIKIFCAICTFEVTKLFENEINSSSSTSNSPLRDLNFNLSVTDFEMLNPHDNSQYLNRSFRSPAFLHGLMTLACKYMMKMKNDSFEKVFNLNFCLFVVLALFKYFEKFIERKLAREKHSSAINRVQANVIYSPACLNVQSSSPFSESSGSNISTAPSIPLDSKQFPSPNTLDSINPYNKAESTTGQSANTPNSNYSVTSSSNTVYNPNSELVGNDLIDELFKNVFTDDNLFSSQLDTNLNNWDFNDFMSTGYGMFYEDKPTTNQHQQ
ncbi:putative transcriptional regulatory protein [Wickerhamomyces ciferrii]|uniref:Transcriptional regulatory protein n=1 Tax=Wickerhamomyces ciferrii (strain ATCC 14091 / BCRC 22168 / CBS 111 / JCM 3599 / NBRC 0793 / NRRL Y-1031 F-60-10) TaxID=1206466 RepID=K0KH10_WICCF|nr:putative transcriptional regulatory protein [Wickerhamomyces ciferrii]CCH40468.1 putative transcriptional regulatory protein [Wickerhamomyces ciferrii]